MFLATSFNACLKPQFLIQMVSYDVASNICQAWDIQHILTLVD
jgi:hypothetical protein